MTHLRNTNKEFWPALPYEEFASTQHLLHMLIQVIGKLKLATPFEPHWANVALWVTSQGFTTGPIPYAHHTFTIDIDFFNHEITCSNSFGNSSRLRINSSSVAKMTQKLFIALESLSINVNINMKPQEIPNPILFNEDQSMRIYNAELANAWWRIIANSHRIMQKYHARFTGRTPPIGLMWGTLDLRDARYFGMPVATTGINADYIRRNAMDDTQVEVGWWSGNEQYKKPAYFSFTYPKPDGIENAIIKPSSARWEKNLGEFIFDYDDMRQAKDPEKELLDFFESTYEAGAKCAHFDPNLISSGEPA